MKRITRLLPRRKPIYLGEVWSASELVVAVRAAAVMRKREVSK